MKIPKKIWEGRRDILIKARDKKLTFKEFNLLSMHKETKDYLNYEKGGLSEEGIAILNSIGMYLETL